LRKIDIRPQNLGRRAPIELGLVGDVAGTIAALLPRLDQKKDTAHLDDARHQYQEARKDLDELAQEATETSDSSAADRSCVSDLASGGRVFTSMSGLPTVWAARLSAMNGKAPVNRSFARLDGQRYATKRSRAVRLSGRQITRCPATADYHAMGGFSVAGAARLP